MEERVTKIPIMGDDYVKKDNFSNKLDTDAYILARGSGMWPWGQK